MLAQIVLVAALIAFAQAQFGGLGGSGGGLGGFGGGSSGGDLHHHQAHSYAQQTLHNGEEHEVVYHGHPKYEYKYGVEDHHTHDSKSKHESRDGDHTQGEYTVHQSDGTILTVHYTVVGKSGYNAVVSRSGHASHPQPTYHH